MENIDKYKDAEIMELEALQIKLIKEEPPDNKDFNIESNYTQSGIEYESIDTINEDIVTYLDVTLENQSDEDESYNDPYNCKICQEGFNTYENLYIHSTVHIQAQADFENMSTCTICLKKFEPRKLTAHFRSHDVKKSYHCCYCTGSYFIQNDLDEHISKCHTTFTCNKCNKSFKKEIDLKDHYKNHTELFPYACSICNETFSTISDLSRHISTHKRKRKLES